MSDDLYRPLVKNAINNLKHYRRKVQRFYDELLKDIDNDIEQLETDVSATQDFYDVYPNKDL